MTDTPFKLKEVGSNYMQKREHQLSIVQEGGTLTDISNAVISIYMKQPPIQFSAVGSIPGSPITFDVEFNRLVMNISDAEVFPVSGLIDLGDGFLKVDNWCVGIESVSASSGTKAISKGVIAERLSMNHPCVRTLEPSSEFVDKDSRSPSKPYHC